jgi:hypothetical protein
MSKRVTERIWNSMVAVSVCELGYEWRPDAPGLARSQWKLHSRYTEVVDIKGRTVERTTGARSIQRSGGTVAKEVVPAFRDLAERLEWLLFDAMGGSNEDRKSRLRHSVFTSEELQAISTMTINDRVDWAQALVRDFACMYGTLTGDPQTITEWFSSLAAFRSIDILCRAIKRERWGDIESRMVNDGSSWRYIDYGIVGSGLSSITICSAGDMWELEDGTQLDWWSIAGRPSQRARIAFAKIINEKLRGGFSVKLNPLVHSLEPGQGALMPNNLICTAYFLLWRSIAKPEEDRYCQRCDNPVPADRAQDPRTKFCSAACKQADYRTRPRSR